MDRIDKNGTAIFLFIAILLILIIGGYFLVSKNYISNKNDNKEYINNNEKKKINKIDNNKDYIYFINEEIIDEENELIYKEIVFNFDNDDVSKLSKKLNELIKKDYKTLEKNEDEITSLSLLDYEIIETTKYVSLTVNEYTYSNNDGKNSNNISYYVIDLYTGKMLSNEDIMKKEKITKQDISNRIKEYIINDNISEEDILDNDYSLSIGKNGKVLLNIIVNKDNLNYNVSIEMD